MEIRERVKWSALQYATLEQNAGTIFQAFKDAGIEGAWLPAFAHLCTETAYFKSFVAPWNYGNIKYFGQSTKGIYLVRFNDDSPKDLFMAYATPQDGINEYVALIKRKYKIDGSESAYDFASKLKAKGYATDHAFVQKVVSVYNSIVARNPNLLTWAHTSPAVPSIPQGNAPQGNTPKGNAPKTDDIALNVIIPISIIAGLFIIHQSISK